MANSMPVDLSFLSPAALPSSERVYRTLRDHIVEGKLLPGTRLVELDLAAQFASSRTPVREALARLSAEGLVAQDGVRGTVVREIDPAEAEEIYVLREVIDGLAGRLAAPRVSEEDTAKLWLLVETQRECVAEGDWLELMRANRRFHEVIYRASGSRHLTEIAMNLHDRVRPFSLRCFASGDRGQPVIHEHVAIAEALAAHDAPAAELASRQHVALTRAHHARLVVSRHNHEQT
jgi:DNA-binding GntR family transcriptional regulator